MKSGQSAAIIGLGLMGGSLARDLSALQLRVLGFDADPEVVGQALEEGVVHQGLPEDLSGIESADLIVVATPVDVGLALLPRLAGKASPGAVITDVGSTKRSMVEGAVRAGVGGSFVGSHPLAGDHRSGWAASRTGLYRGVSVFVSPTAESSSDALGRIGALWSAVGATVISIPAEEHDRRMAWISHLPQILSSALSGTLSTQGISQHDLGPGGRDMVRLAASSPEMWSAICQSNADNILDALEALRHRLERVEKLIAEGDGTALREYFREGRSPTP